MKIPRQSRRGRDKKEPKRLTWTDPHSLAAQVERHLGWLEARGYAETSVEGRRRDIVAFVTWCTERGVTRPPELTRLVLDLYQKRVARMERRDGATISPRTQRLKLLAVAGFCKWLARERLVLYNPAAELELPRVGHYLPRTVLSADEAEQVLAVPDVATPLGLRDRAILETFYSTGIRRSELMRLEVVNIDLSRQILAIRQGKGKRDRFVPIGERALAWIGRYLEEVRPQLVVLPDPGHLYLTADGTPLGRNHLGKMVSTAVAMADIGKQGACHLFRHTMATLMLEHGADIRFIQQMLGHARLETTQIYTQVSLDALKAVYNATHPGARLRRRRDETGKEAAAGEERSSSSGPSILLDEEEIEA